MENEKQFPQISDRNYEVNDQDASDLEEYLNDNWKKLIGWNATPNDYMYIDRIEEFKWDDKYRWFISMSTDAPRCSKKRLELTAVPEFDRFSNGVRYQLSEVQEAGHGSPCIANILYEA